MTTVMILEYGDMTSDMIISFLVLGRHVDYYKLTIATQWSIGTNHNPQEQINQKIDW